MKKSNEKAKLMGLSGLVAAGIGSVCCIGPSILVGLGFGAGALSFVRGLGILHLPMMFLAIILLGLAFYIHLKNSKQIETNLDCCKTKPDKSKQTMNILWTATGLSMVLFLLPYFI